MVNKKSSIFFSFLIFAFGSWLFYLKYTVISIEERIRHAKKELIVERKNHHILKAEWKTLTTPERIQQLAMKHLNMRQIEPSQLREFDPAIFHTEKSKYKETKKLSKLVDEIISSKDGD
jgi:cell division protein FtsL